MVGGWEPGERIQTGPKGVPVWGRDLVKREGIGVKYGKTERQLAWQNGPMARHRLRLGREVEGSNRRRTSTRRCSYLLQLLFESRCPPTPHTSPSTRKGPQAMRRGEVEEIPAVMGRSGVGENVTVLPTSSSNLHTGVSALSRLRMTSSGGNIRRYLCNARVWDSGAPRTGESWRRNGQKSTSRIFLPFSVTLASEEDKFLPFLAFLASFVQYWI